MSIPTIVGLALCIAAIAFILVALIVLGLRATRVAKRVRRIAQHPSVEALAQLGEQANGFQDTVSRIQALGPRFLAIAQASAEVSADLASLELNVDRLAFGTRLVLRVISAGFGLRN